ncbi:uncharacterized protein LOC118284065 [Scophthalmus maximus]|uniref:uncharacterized protein LOC118284065 n=1 Tax=Scophthalmus maximus TaxID=52904 RepID=UPI001FA822E1|nr:uncharacterized protein LOC118284065 [Scophthalmus maximus]
MSGAHAATWPGGGGASRHTRPLPLPSPAIGRDETSPRAKRCPDWSFDNPPPPPRSARDGGAQGQTFVLEVRLRKRTELLRVSRRGVGTELRCDKDNKTSLDTPGRASGEQLTPTGPRVYCLPPAAERHHRADRVHTRRVTACHISPAFLRMDTGPAAPPPPMAAGPSPLWRLAERRCRKAGSGNIFSNVNLCQLQRLFKAAGDQDAEQRAQVVWGHRDEAELAQALIGLRTRSHRRGPRANGRDALGSHWLRAFNHLRIGESSLSSQGSEAGEETDSEAGAHGGPEPRGHPAAGATGRCARATAVPSERRSLAGTSERPVRVGSGLRRGGGGESDPERYLHQILH